MLIAELKEKYERSKGISIIPSEDSHDEHHGENLHLIIGLALVLGFIFMLLIDQIGSNSRARGALNPPLVVFYLI